MSTDRIRVAKDHVTSASTSALLKKRLFDQSKALSEQLNFTQLQPYFLTPKYRFLNDEEIDQIADLTTDREKGNKLLLILRKKSWSKILRFLACVFAEDEHSGHEDLCVLFRDVLPSEEIKKVWRLTRKHTVKANNWYRYDKQSSRAIVPESSIATDGPRPELPMTLIQYE